MSAIAGIFYRDGMPVDRASLEGMRDALSHRGPDGSGVWRHGATGLVNQMMWTTPESLSERLPRAGRDGACVLTADARIDNRDELLSALDLTGDRSDSELILHAYERWGEECPSKLLGDFAFAIWDARQRKLFCVRDPMGVKSFYYYCSHRVFAFATEIKALLQLSEVPRRLNEVRVGDLLAGVPHDPTVTLYRDIYRLPASHGMTVTDESAHVGRYWDFNPSRRARPVTDGEYAAGFRAIFQEAVRCRLRSAYPVGSTLSGGLDSSSVACMARTLLTTPGRPRLHTFSATFPDLPPSDLRSIDEREYVEAVLALGGFEPHYVRADRLSPLLDVTRLLWHNDEAHIGPNLYMHWALFSAAQRCGVRVFLDGIDGDTVVSHGLDYLPELLWRGRWRGLLLEASAISSTLNTSYSPHRVIREYGLRPLVPPGVLDLWRLLHGRRRAPWGPDTIVRRDFVRRVGLDERVRELLKSEQAPVRSQRDGHLRGLTSPLIPYALELADKMAAAHNLDVRYPFFDRRLMEYCLSLPPEQKLHRGWTRVVMRRAMNGVLPPTVQWRRQKSNLSPNFVRGLLQCDRATLDRVLTRDSSRIEEYVDLATVRTAYQRSQSASTSTPQDAIDIYRAAVLALWLEDTGIAP